MCTVTIIPLVGPDGQRTGLRLATNRDESRKRPPARPPRVHRSGNGQSIWPVDPTGGGTWVGVNDFGLVTTLLNRHDGTPRPTEPAARSRGDIIPALLAATSLPEAEQRLREFDARAFLPFTLVLFDRDRFIHAASIAGCIEISHGGIGFAPLMFTSSGLGDALVEAPRRALFDGWFDADPQHWEAQQDAFQRHHWADRPHLSVCMSREEARTVSLTVVEVTDVQVQMRYWAQPPCEAGVPIAFTLPRSGANR